MNNEMNIQERLRPFFDRGLSEGLGHKDGQVCIEAAISLACGEPFSDRPSCVAEPDRLWAIRINDAGWPSPEARASSLWPVALAQLGTAGKDRSEWAKRVVEGTIRRIAPLALRAAAEHCANHAEALLSAALRCENEGSKDAADEAAYVAEAAYAAALAANAANAANAAFAADYAVAAAAATAVANAAQAVCNVATAADYAADYAAADAADYADAAADAADAAKAASLAKAGVEESARLKVLKIAVRIALDAYEAEST